VDEFDPIEIGARARARSFIEELIEAELEGRCRGHAKAAWRGGGWGWRGGDGDGQALTDAGVATARAHWWERAGARRSRFRAPG
jgi:hypothetical protein